MGLVIASLSKDEIEGMLYTLQYAADHGYETLIAFDPVDMSFKFKINNGTWTPPIGSIHADSARPDGWYYGYGGRNPQS